MRRTADDKMMEQIGGMAPRGALLYSNQRDSSVTLAPDSSSTLCGEVGEDRLDTVQIQASASPNLWWKMPERLSNQWDSRGKAVDRWI